MTMLSSKTVICCGLFILATNLAADEGSFHDRLRRNVPAIVAPAPQASNASNGTQVLQSQGTARPSPVPAPSPAPVQVIPVPAPSPAPKHEIISEEVIDNPDVLGCTWPENYKQRFLFCADKSKLILNKEADYLHFGVLDPNIMERSLKQCSSAEKDCGDELSDENFTDFVNYWRQNNFALAGFKTCLEKNTAGMIKLCGAEAKVSKIVSGVGGLHLNLLNILTNLAEHSLYSTNSSAFTCRLKIAKAAYKTVLYHIYKKHYKENVVMCWDVANGCTPLCAKLAADLACAHHSCTNFTLPIMQQFGIWQWYYNDPTIASKKCQLPEHVCGAATLNKSDETKPALYQFKEKVVHKLNEWKGDLEHLFHQPIQIIGAAFGAGLFIFVVIVAIGCFWYQGAICTRQRKPIKYSVLLNGDRSNSDEMKSLAAHSEFDDIE